MVNELFSNKLVVVGGPTASGKTDLAVNIANKYNGEIINADSRQIYKYLDIGTNKGPITPTNENILITTDQVSNYGVQNPFDDSDTYLELPVFEMYGVRTHLMSFLDPKERFNVFKYKKLADFMISDVISRGKLPIIVGGTGLYIDAILKDYDSEGLEEYYDKEFHGYLIDLDISILQNMLITENKALFDSLNNSDRNNPRRLIRLIEKLKAMQIKQSSEKLLGTSEAKTNQYDSSKKDFKFFYPKFTWDGLKERINKRALQMFEEGLVEETKKVLSKGYTKDDPALHTMGYRHVIEFIEGKYDLNKCVELVQTAHRQYAIKQRTWFEGEGRGYNLQIVSTDDKINI